MRTTTESVQQLQSSDVVSSALSGVIALTAVPLLSDCYLSDVNTINSEGCERVIVRDPLSVSDFPFTETHHQAADRLARESAFPLASGVGEASGR